VGRSRAVVLGLVLFIAGAAWLGLRDATTGGDWPGWDEGWALVAFPLGVPLALYVAAGVAKAQSPTRVATIGTLAVWLWGAAVFVTWMVIGR
jgi:small-conductance mechanosensitive channel